MNEPPTAAQMRRRIDRALMELDGNVSEPMHPAKRRRLLGAAMARYHGPALALGIEERLEGMSHPELEQLTDALEERAAIVGAG